MNLIGFPRLGLGPFEITHTAFSIGPVSVQWYGIIIVFGMFLACLYAFWRMKSVPLVTDDMLDIAIAVSYTHLINIFQPEVLVIGGGICNEKNYLLDPLNKIVATEQYSRNSAKKTELRIAKLGNDAGIIGAAMLGL